MHQNKEHLTWDKTVRESLPCTPSPNTHTGDASAGAMQKKNPPKKKKIKERSTDEIASSVGLRQLPVSVNHHYGKPSISKSRGRPVTRDPSQTWQQRRI